MLAHIQRLVILLLVVASTLSAWLFIRSGHPALALMSALAIAMSYSVVLAAEFVLLHAVNGRSALAPAAADLLLAWIGEAASTPRVFFWRQPFFSGSFADHLPVDTKTQRGVVLVHGLFCNRGFWNPWMATLRERNIPYVAVNLEPIFGSIDRYRSAIERAVAALEASTGQPVVLVGHSMGGLAIRAWLAVGRNRSRTHHALTIGTPHRGTWLARHSATMNGRQMRIGSHWLADLASRESSAGNALFTCFYSACDNIVFPSSCATLPGALNLRGPDVGHVGLAFEAVIFDAVYEALVEPPDPATSLNQPAS